jgi:ABC-2 type transport system ATP-binding protein
MNHGDVLVSLRNVTKTYGNFRAIDNISLEIKRGEIFGYIGPNGAGKTTTMKILVGLISDFQGEVTIGSYQVPQQKEKVYKLLGYLPQNVAFQEWRTVNNALKTLGKLSDLSNNQVEERIPEVLDLIGLSEFGDKKIAQLSGGMTQKVGLAQALLHDPKLLILDEPLGGLDPISRYQFKEIVKKLSTKGTTVLFSSHILSDVQDVADSIGILSGGRIMEIGSLEELKRHFSPNNVVEVILSSPSNKWQQLAEIEGVKTIQQPTQVRILVMLQPETDSDKAINRILKAIVELEIQIRSISLLEASLDEIYLNYVKGDKN